MKIVRTDRELQTPIVDEELKAAGHELVLLPDGVSEQDLVTAVGDADLLLMCYTPITARVVEAAGKLRGIVKYGVGIDAIDIPAASARGITVVNIPEYAEQTVAEGAFAMLIALAKRLTALDRQMKQAGWAWPEPAWMGADIAGKTLGIVGFGKIGRSMARIAGAGFRARVLAYDPLAPEAEMNALGVTGCNNLDAMLTECDFVSIHCVLNNDTRSLIGEIELRSMKPGAFLINTSRGAIVDEDALLRALDQKWIAGAGLDVYGREPLSLSDHLMSSLFAHPDVILSPHLTFYTRESMQRLELETLERCFELLDRRPLLIKSRDPRLRNQGGDVIYEN